METGGFIDSCVAALAQPEALRCELARAFESVARYDATVAFRSGEHVATACVRDSSSAVGPAFATIEIGCVAKLLTAALARAVLAGGALAPDDEVLKVLGRSAASRVLRGISVRQLLDHTHGLDDSRIVTVPRRADHRIDVDALARALGAAPVLAPPGAIYSYGSAGAWLVAALLERLDGRPYSEQVRARILAPLEIFDREPRPLAPICPAAGGALALDAEQLLRFVAHAALRDPETWPDENRAGVFGPICPLPGWNPLERGVHLGWKYCGGGWFGHQSVRPRASLLVRANPRRALAFVVASREHSAAVVAARVFGAHLPELFDLRITAQPNVARIGPLVGTFGSAAWSVAIRRSRGGLELRVRRRGKPGVSRAVLQPSAGRVWFARPAVVPFPHVEIVTLESGTDFLWNGRFVLRKIDRASASTRSVSKAYTPAHPLAGDTRCVTQPWFSRVRSR